MRNALFKKLISPKQYSAWLFCSLWIELLQTSTRMFLSKVAAKKKCHHLLVYLHTYIHTYLSVSFWPKLLLIISTYWWLIKRRKESQNTWMNNISWHSWCHAYKARRGHCLLKLIYRGHSKLLYFRYCIVYICKE